MPVGRWRLSKDARRDLRGIDRYTREEWGREQADRYGASLDAAFDRLAAYPALGQDRPSAGLGVRTLLVERHLVMDRVVPEGVLILRMVHLKMNPADLNL